MLHKATIFIILTTIMLTISCSGGEMEQKKVTYNSLKDIPDAAWEKLSQKKIFFGHQSVGFNIIDGIQDLMKEYPQIKLNIVELSNSKDLKNGILAHSRIGENTNPKLKIDSFVNFIDEGIGAKADAVALKLCYVDITANTIIDTVFTDYKNKVKKIKKKYQDLRIIHFTVPLTQKQTGLKVWIKRLIRKPVAGIEDNIKRNEYNDLLLKEFQGKDPILDIARIESTYPDLKRCFFEKDGKVYYSLLAEYTDDGGHLNDLGRKMVAEKFLILLANMS